MVPSLALGALAYLGPETMMPLTSIAAAAVGVVLMMWQRIVGAARGTFRWVGRAFGRVPADRPVVDGPPAAPAPPSGDAIPRP